MLNAEIVERRSESQGGTRAFQRPQQLCGNWKNPSQRHRAGHRKPTLRDLFSAQRGFEYARQRFGVRRIEQELAMDGERISKPQ